MIGEADGGRSGVCQQCRRTQRPPSDRLCTRRALHNRGDSLPTCTLGRASIALSERSTRRLRCFRQCRYFSRCRYWPSSSWLAAWNRSMCPPAKPYFPKVIRLTLPSHRGRRGGCGRRRSAGHQTRSWRWIGEIAFLRRVQRTATVMATAELELQALTCNRFLPVIAGFPPSAREAGAEVEEMLGGFSPGESTDDQIGPRH
jgi:hypothetical protein